MWKQTNSIVKVKTSVMGRASEKYHRYSGKKDNQTQKIKKSEKMKHEKIKKYQINLYCFHPKDRTNWK